MATKEQIWSAANTLNEEDKTPTLAAVREQLSGSSYTDISAAMCPIIEKTHCLTVIPE